ncbi:GOLPH3/VPS74 family protein [Dactylosporangium matsuzakiense]|uniref:Golgi phosphoprotein 3 GPP34 n=1 Tax=Dactylosporangium matsuzakiense TaxID=53360 RepID=A0A9W6KP15_9ACTN|nr:GPP34 family phosphoprotein [Dactylosporangium matsuzakiense]UWZ44677.1 GPP34 family phosphoprotein [Dactylosporangium matsuzakiense]GLL04698.1 hypothetical protein GCM10017581_064450 [Dactylosporangium matsuzakiense]
MKAGAAVWRAPMRPADDLWCVAHEERDWRCLLHPAALGLGLAGGFLGELALTGHIVIDDHDVVRVTDLGPPLDAFLHVALAYMQADRPLEVRTWLQFFARGKAEALVLERLGLAGLVEETPVSRLRRHGTRSLRPTDRAGAGWRAVRLRHVIVGDLPSMPQRTWADLTVAGLAQAVGLLPAVLWEDHAAADAWLSAYLAERASHTFARLLAAVQTLVGDAVLSGRL